MRTRGAASSATAAASVMGGSSGGGARAPPAGPKPSVFLYRDRPGRAPVDGLAQTVAELLGRVLVQHVEVPVVAHLEDLGHDAHAHGVAGTLVEVNDDLHGDLLDRVRGLAPPSISAVPEAARPLRPGPAAPPGRRPSGLLGRDHPHGEELRAAAVRLAQRPSHAVDLMLAGQPA